MRIVIRLLSLGEKEGEREGGREGGRGREREGKREVGREGGSEEDRECVGDDDLLFLLPVLFFMFF